VAGNQQTTTATAAPGAYSLCVLTHKIQSHLEEQPNEKWKRLQSKQQQQQPGAVSIKTPPRSTKAGPLEDDQKGSTKCFQLAPT
jgi:hypothetical protein